MGLFNRKNKNNDRSAASENRMKHCVIYDVYFILTENQCKNCKHYKECYAYEDHRDFEDGELFFMFAENGRPLPFAYFSRKNGDDSLAIEPYDFDAPKPPEATISLIESEFDNFYKTMNLVKNKTAYATIDSLPDKIELNTPEGSFLVPLKSILTKLEASRDLGPDSTEKYRITLNADESLQISLLVHAIARGLPPYGYLAEESWIRKVHALIPVLSGRLMGAV